MIEQGKLDRERTTVECIIKSIPTSWVRVNQTSLNEVVSAKGVNSTVKTILRRLLRDLKIIETEGEKAAMKYRRIIIDSVIPQAVEAIIDQFRYKEGYENKTFVTDEDIRIVRKSKVNEPENKVIHKVDLSINKVEKRFFTVGDQVFLMHDNLPTKGVIKASDAKLDSNGNVIKVIYEISLSPDYTKTIVSSKIFASKTSMANYLTNLILGDNENTNNM